MKPMVMRTILSALVLAGLALPPAPAMAETSHGIAMYGLPALPPDFVSLPYADPDAPKGGRIVFGESGGFDSLNPWILKGSAPWGLGIHTVETLMARSIDEPFTLYGLLAESVETDAARSFVAFTLREGATFSDGSPITVEDVIWSYQTLGTEGHPRYREAWSKVAAIEATGPRSLRISFTEADRELPLLMGLRPVLKKAEWQGRDFAAGSLMVPTGSGPYVVDRFEPGRFITFRRNPDYWGRDLAINRGLHNLDEIRYDYFGDGDVAFQAFTAGEITSYRESSAAKWAAQYDFAAVRSGEVVKSEIPHHRPSGMTGLVMNTRNPVLADWRAREALILAFNFEFINQTLNGGLEPRITSYFGNSALAMDAGPATGRVAELLAPFAASLLPGTTEGYTLPRGDPARAIDRGNLRRATALLQEAGWSVTASGRLEDAGGRPFAIDILLPAGATGAQTITDIYVAALASLGITPTITTVDAAQYRERTKDYSFDLTWFTRALSLSPGNEQRLYWGGWGVNEPGSRNLMGMDDPAAEAMIDAMLTAATEADFRAAVQALDRILTAGRYVIPVWHSPVARIAHSAHLHYPARLPLYGDWPGFQPEVWWYRE